MERGMPDLPMDGGMDLSIQSQTMDYNACNLRFSRRRPRPRRVCSSLRLLQRNNDERVAVEPPRRDVDTRQQRGKQPLSIQRNFRSFSLVGYCVNDYVVPPALEEVGNDTTALRGGTDVSHTKSSPETRAKRPPPDETRPNVKY